MELMLGLGAILIAYTFSSIKVIKEYERYVIFTLGRADGIRGPGMQFVLPVLQNSKKVDTRIMTMPIPLQEIITKDNVSVKTAAVCFFQVVDPLKAVTKIEDPYDATNQIARATSCIFLHISQPAYLFTQRSRTTTILSVILHGQTYNQFTTSTYR